MGTSAVSGHRVRPHRRPGHGAGRPHRSARIRWSRWLVTAGLLGLLVGAHDPLEGSLVILPGAALVALGAHLGRSRGRQHASWSLVPATTGVAAVWIASAGGSGPGSGRSAGWGALVLLPYAAG